MKLLNVEKLRNGFLNIVKLVLENRDGDEVTREVIDKETETKTDDAVAALVYNTVSEKFIFVKQHRAGLYKKKDPFLLEVVAGVLEKGESSDICIEREILEETGYKVDELKFVDFGYSSPGICTEQLFLFVAKVSEKIEAGGGLDEENEEIEVIEMTLEEVERYRFRDLKTSLLLTYKDEVL